MSKPSKLDLRSQEFVQDFMRFTNESIGVCIKEAETAVSNILRVLQFIIDDSKRVTQMSEDTLKALAKVRETFASQEKGPGRAPSVLIKALSEFVQRHAEAEALLSPVIEALQFQDSIRQNTENILRMISAWLDYREKARRLGIFDENQRFEFGTQLLACTTMKQERDIIRYHFSELPAEEEGPEEPIFF